MPNPKWEHVRTNARVAVMTSLLALSGAGSAATLTTLASFTETGPIPAAGVTGLLIDGSGNLFGVTRAGGQTGGGTVFTIPAGAGAITILASMGIDDAPAEPSMGLIADAGGNLFGTTRSYGLNGYGTIYTLAAGTNAVTTLVNFNETNGSPSGGLVADTAGNMYGLTSRPGGGGSVFKLAAGANTITTVTSFEQTDYSDPRGRLTVDASGNLYGATFQGGTSGLGSIFKVAAGTNTISTLASFDASTGNRPAGALILDASGDLYGTTFSGGAFDHGTLFKLAAGSTTITTLAEFDLTSGSPTGHLVADASRNLFGTAGSSVFKFASDTNTLTTVESFSLGVSGRTSNLIADAAGNLYGSTVAIDEFGNGGLNTVYRLSDTGFVVNDPTVVPEPSTWGMLVVGFGLIGVTVRRDVRRTAQLI